MVALDDAWKFILVFVAGVLIGYLFKQSQTTAKMQPYTLFTDFTREPESGRIVTIVEKLTPTVQFSE